MAVVMLSDKLVRTIIWNIQRPLEQKTQELQDKARALLNSHAEHAWDYYTRGDQPGLNGANEDYMRLSDEIFLTIRGRGVVMTGKGKLRKARPVTYPMTSGQSGGLNYREDFPDYNEINDLLVRAEELKKETKEVDTKMRALCSQCGSLADLIKIFPTVQNYLDHETKERLARKVERKKNKPKELPEELASTLVKSHIFQNA